MFNSFNFEKDLVIMSLPRDPSSAANLSEATVKNISLIWDVSFEKKSIAASATYDIEFLSDADKIIFDIRDLDICDISAPCEATFTIEDNEFLAQKLLIQFSQKFVKSDNLKFTLRYNISKNASALQFVDAELTSCKKAPFLYSQCEPALARSIVPCMDSPGIKQTYDATVTVPSNVVCLMSAFSTGSKKLRENTITFTFQQPIAIPSYLLAIVVGALERREISERCAIWAEPSLVDAACYEFAETEKLLNIAESLLGEYVWTRYDMVVLPPFFPWGGMENPMLTFLTPSIIAGDRSMVSTIAHEIAHSWTGNLVTNANWSYFWLNEGFTKFIEHKIMSRLYDEEFRHFIGYTDWYDVLKPAVYETFSPTHELTKLVPNLEGIDPEDNCSVVPYIKGSAFLFLLEQKLGGSEVFNLFLQAYIAKYARKSVTAQQFIDYLYEYFADKKSIIDGVQINKWLYEPGMPPEMPVYKDTRVKKCRKIVDIWVENSVEELRDMDPNEFLNMHPYEKSNVISTLEYEPECALSQEKIALFDEKYKMSELKHNDLLNKWIALALRCKYRPVIPLALKFITDFGRVKYLQTIYKRLFEWDETREMAINCFHNNSETMHPISVNYVKSLLKEKI